MKGLVIAHSRRPEAGKKCWQGGQCTESPRHGEREGQPRPYSRGTGRAGSGSRLWRAPVSPHGSSQDVLALELALICLHWPVCLRRDADSSPFARGVCEQWLALSPREADGPRIIAGLGDAHRLPSAVQGGVGRRQGIAVSFPKRRRRSGRGSGGAATGTVRRVRLGREAGSWERKCSGNDYIASACCLCRLLLF